MKKILLLATTVVLGFANNVYTVDDLIIKALENSPEIKISAKELDASQSRKDIAFSGYLPTIDLVVSGGEVGRRDTISDTMINDSLLLGQLSLEQLIYDFGKTSGNYDSFAHDVNSYLHQHNQNISNIKKDVKNAYYQVLQSIALIKVNREDVKLNEKQLYRAQKYFEAGIRTKIDVSDAKVRLIQSKITLRKSQYDLKLAYSSLDRIIGFTNVQNNYKVYSQDLDLNNLYTTLKDYALNLEDSIAFAYIHREDIKKLQTKILVSNANKTLANAQYYPSIYASADYTKQNADTLQSIMPDDQYQAFINLSWNIYSGGKTDASTQEQSIQENIALLSLENTKLSIKQDVSEAFINVYKMKDSVELSQTLLEASREKFTQAQKRYEHGLSDYIELQESKQGYINSMASLVVDYYNYYGAVATLDNAIGR